MDRQINMSSLYWYNNVFGGIGNGASSMSGNIVSMSEKRKSSNDYSLAVQPLLKSKALTWFDENLMGLVELIIFYFINFFSRWAILFLFVCLLLYE